MLRKSLWTSACIAVLVLVVPLFAAVADDEEFVGPLAGWKDLKTDYSAVGDGIADDTPALQRALDSLTKKSGNPTLYIPAGTYRITQTVRTSRGNSGNGNVGFAIIGEDPTKTLIVWDGPAKAAGVTDTSCNMLNLHGWYCKVARLSFDGKSKVWCGIQKMGDFSTSCEYSDVYFKDMDIGILFSDYPLFRAGQAENFINRCRFVRCTFAGIEAWDWNSMDEWVYRCYFEDCGYAVYGMGCNVIKCTMLRSTKSDIGAIGTMFAHFVDNLSIGSKNFISGGTGSNVIRKNRIFDVKDTAFCFSSNISIIDNVVKNAAGNTKPSIIFKNSGLNLICVGNTFTVANYMNEEDWGVSGCGWCTIGLKSIDNQVVDPSTLATPTYDLPVAPLKMARTIFEVQKNTGNDALEIMQKIAAAVTDSSTSKHIVHIPAGSYLIRNTITIPANKDLQIVGDGSSVTVLTWSGATGGTVFNVRGPSKAQLRDFIVKCNKTSGVAANGILIDNCDQAGGRIYGEQITVNGINTQPLSTYGAAIGFYMNTLDYTDVNFIGSGASLFKNGWVAKGGPIRAAGNAATNQITFLSGACAINDYAYSVSNGASIVSEAIYHEGWGSGMPPHMFKLENTSGNITVSSCRLNIDQTTWGDAPILLNNFSGKFCLLNNEAWINNSGGQFWTKILGNGANTKVALINFQKSTMGSTGCPDPLKFMQDSTVPQAQTSALYAIDVSSNCGQPANTNYMNITNRVPFTNPSDSFILDMLADIRASRFDQPTEISGTATDVKLRRIIVNSDLVALEMRGTKTVGVVPSGFYSLDRTGTLSAIKTANGIRFVNPGTQQNVNQLSLFDVYGRMICSLNGQYGNGLVVYEWNGKTTLGSVVANGILVACDKAGHRVKFMYQK